MRDAGFQNLDTGDIHFFLNRLLQLVRNFLAGTAQRTLTAVFRRIIRVQADDIPQCGVALDGKVFTVIVYIEYRFGRVDNLPDDDDADFNRIPQFVIDFLAGVAQGQALLLQSLWHPAWLPS